MFFIYILALFSFLVTLIVTLRRISKQIPSKRKYSYIYIILILFPFIIGFTITYFHPSKPKKTLVKPVDPEVVSKDSIFRHCTEQQLQDSVELDFVNYKKHLLYIEKHFSDFKKKSDQHLVEVYEPHAGIKNYYWYKTESWDTNFSVTSKWAQGVIFFYEQEFDSSIKVLKQYPNKPYSNLLIGLSFNSNYKSQRDSAAYYYLSEYDSKPQLLPDSLKDEVISTVIHSKPSDLITIKACYIPEFANRIPDYITREVYFKNYDWIKYLKVYLKSEIKNVITYDFIVSLIVMGMWLVYLLQLDVFQKKNWKYIVFTIGFSALLSEFVPFVYEYFEYIHYWDLSGNAFHDFLFCVFGIGFFEETSKLLPLVFLMVFTSEPDESYDYIFYPSLSALGFALMENSMYFHNYGGVTIIARALTSTVAHVFFTSLVGYGLLIAHHFNKNKFLLGALFFLLAMLSHGIYDWLLIYNFNLVFYICFFGSIMIWFVFVNNSLNVSKHFSMFVKIDYRRMELIFVAFIGLILISQYLIDQFYNKNNESLKLLWISVFFSVFFLLFFVNRIGKMDLVQGYWRKISLLDHYNEAGGNNFYDIRTIFINFFVVNAVQPMNYYGLKLRIFHNDFVGNNALKKGLELSGTAMERVKIKSRSSSGNEFIDTHYFWIHLDDVIKIGTHVTNSILVKQLDSFENIDNGLPVDISIVGLRVEDGIIPNTINQENTFFIGYALVQLVE